MATESHYWESMQTRYPSSVALCPDTLFPYGLHHGMSAFFCFFVLFLTKERHTEWWNEEFTYFFFIFTFLFFSWYRWLEPNRFLWLRLVLRIHPTACVKSTVHKTPWETLAMFYVLRDFIELLKIYFPLCWDPIRVHLHLKTLSSYLYMIYGVWRQ